MLVGADDRRLFGIPDPVTSLWYAGDAVIVARWTSTDDISSD